MSTRWDIVYFYVLDNVKIMVTFESICLELKFTITYKMVKHF